MKMATRRTVKVPLSGAVEWHDKLITEVEIREPTAATFFKLGPLQMLVSSASGGGSIVDIEGRLEAYFERCVSIENGAHFLQLLSLRDGRAIKTALIDFFHQDAAEGTLS